MSLYRVVTKRRKCCNGVNIEAGMEAQVVAPVNMTVQVNNLDIPADSRPPIPVILGHLS